MANEQVNIELIIEAGRTASTLGEVKQSIKDVNRALLDVKFGTKEWNELHEIFLKNRATIKSLKQEFADIKQVETIGKVVASSFALATSAMEVFGSENEKVNEGIRKTAASLELLLSFKELARSIREAQIANEGLNASLLTNPYVLLAAAIAGVGFALFKSADDSTEMGRSLVELKERASTLSPVWDVLKEGLIGFGSSLVQGTAAVFNYTASLLGLQPVHNQAKEDLEKLEAIIAESPQRVKNHSAEIERNAALFKSTTSDKIALAKNEIEVAKQVAEQYKYENDKYIEIGKNKEFLQRIAEKDKEALKTQAEANEIYQKYQDALNKVVITQNELNKIQKEIDEKAAHEKELKDLEALVKGYNDLSDSHKHILELLNLSGASAKQTNNLALAYNASEKKYLEDQIKLLLDKGKLDKDQQATLVKLKDDLKNVNYENDKLVQTGLNIDKDDKLKKQLSNLDAYNDAYQQLVKTLQFVYDLRKAEGATESELIDLKRNNLSLSIQALQVEIATTQAEDIGDEEKKKRLKTLNDSLTALIRQQAILNAETNQYNKTHLFSPEQMKEVQQAQRYLQAIGQLISRFGQLATQVAQQEADKRIAIYQRENDQAQEQLQKRLDLGLITQEQFNQKKKQLDDKLAKQKAEEEKKAFKVQKATAIVQATINGAVGIMNALATAPTIIAGIVMAALVGATTAAEIGLIAAQQPPAYALGGIFNGDGSVEGTGTGTSDSINARLSNGESVINAKSTKAFAPLLSAINQAGGGVAFNGQPALQNPPTGAAPNAVSAPQQAAPQRVYVTEYDITRTQNKVSVIQDRSTF